MGRVVIRDEIEFAFLLLSDRDSDGNTFSGRLMLDITNAHHVLYCGAFFTTDVACIYDSDTDSELPLQFHRGDLPSYECPRKDRIVRLDFVEIAKENWPRIDCLVDLKQIKYRSEADRVDMDECRSWNTRMEYDWLILTIDHTLDRDLDLKLIYLDRNEGMFDKQQILNIAINTASFLCKHQMPASVVEPVRLDL